jgi:hypothetical protein
MPTRFFGYQFQYPWSEKITDQQQNTIYFVMSFTPGTVWVGALGLPVSKYVNSVLYSMALVHYQCEF